MSPPSSFSQPSGTDLPTRGARHHGSGDPCHFSIKRIRPALPVRRRPGEGGSLPAGSLSKLSNGLLALFLALAVPAAAQTPIVGAGRTPAALTETLRKVTARYARTDARITELVGRRLNPQPLPASLPNPFYHGVELSELAAPEPAPELAPAAPDISDADTLARLAPTLRISGLVTRDHKPHLIINSVVCKVGDVFPISGQGAPVFIQVRKIAHDSFTLGLNDAELTIPLKL